MAVKIRLTRKGKKRQPTYRVVVADSRSPRDGRFIEQIGRYDPRQEPSLIEIDTERASYWLANGAQPTGQVRKLLEIAGALQPRSEKARRVHVVEEDAQRAAEAEAAAAVEGAEAEVDDDTAPDFELDDEPGAEEDSGVDETAEASDDGEEE